MGRSIGASRGSMVETEVRLVTGSLGHDILQALETADTAYLIVAFLMESGIRILMPGLKAAAQRGAEVRILTGDYLYVTEPAALRTLLSLGDRVEVRLWRSGGRSFHPKAYLFEASDGRRLAIIGSSNVSREALGSGIEWNVAIPSPLTVGPDPFDHFMRLFLDDATEEVTEATVHAYERERDAQIQVYGSGLTVLADREAGDGVQGGDSAPGPDREPKAGAGGNSDPLTLRPAQEAALAALEDTRAEGYSRALVILPTGLGKTVIAGVFARQFRRVLFLAHRDEILEQALTSFGSILPGRSARRYTGPGNGTDADLVFGSVMMFARHRHREVFAPDAFDLIVVDEFHHAAARSYGRILDYFHPDFLLGLTATPDRKDGRDVYALCDGNVAFRLDLPEAVGKGWLSPFRYFGVYDPIDYAALWRNGRYDEEALAREQTRKEHGEAIFRAWMAKHQTRTLVFCTSTAQAGFLCSLFREHGVNAAHIGAFSSAVKRQAALRDLADGRLEAVFSVDVLNEGVDVPAVDTILMARPTDSSTVFLQQLGRGLRPALGKSSCTVVDLLGNYRNVDMKLDLLGIRHAILAARRPSGASLVADGACGPAELEWEAVDLLRRLIRRRTPGRDLLADSYHTLKEELHRRPTYLEFHLMSGIPDSRLVQQEFRSYVGMLRWLEELDPDESRVFLQFGSWLEEVERTGMVKSYKMILLQEMLARGTGRWTAPVRAEEVAKGFHAYLMARTYRTRIDFSDGIGRSLWEFDERRVADLIRRMPMTQWAASGHSLIALDGDRFRVNLRFQDEEESAMVAEWTRQITEYRLHRHFEKHGIVIE